MDVFSARIAIDRPDMMDMFYYRIHQKHRRSNKGEDYAERFATSRFGQLFPAYVRVFGHPSSAA